MANTFLKDNNMGKFAQLFFLVIYSNKDKVLANIDHRDRVQSLESKRSINGYLTC